MAPGSHRFQNAEKRGVSSIHFSQIDAVRPDDLLILPWNLREEIMAQTARIRAWGGRFVTASPEPRTWD